MNKTIETVKVELKLSAPISVTTKSELNFSKNPETACTIPKGTKLDIYFSEVNSSRIYFDYAGSLRAATLINAHKNFTGFSKSPSINTLEKWENEGGYCRTPTGHKTEPDGYGPDGSPSWMLVMGII